MFTRVALMIVSVAFLSGFLITVISGSARAVKIFLAVVGVLGFISIVVALVLSGNLFVFLMFQYIVVLLILCFIIIAGAVCGGGVWLLIHRKTPGLVMKGQDLSDFLPLAEFSAQEGITEERAMARIESGYYEGGRFDGKWYIRKSELSTDNS